MTETLAFLADLGRVGVPVFWVPLLFWSVAVLPFYLGLRLWPNAHALVHYHGSLALLMALPLSFLLMPFAAPLMDAPLPMLNTDSLVEASRTWPAPFLLATAPPEGLALLNRPPAPVSYVSLGLLTLLAGVLALGRLVRLSAQARALRRFRRQLRPLQDLALQNLAHHLAARIGLGKPAQLLVGAPGTAPMTFGWRRPVVVLPESLLAEDTALRMALLHELIHVHRRDYAVGWLVRLVAAVFIIHPGVMILKRRIDLFRELSCDAGVVFHEKQSLDRYARLLLRLHEGATSPAAPSMLSPSSSLKRRICAMERRSHTLPAPYRMSLTLAGFFFLAPALLVACTSTDALPASEDSENVRRLEAQVAYLQAELATTAAELTASPAPEVDPVEYPVERLVLERRHALLDAMLAERMHSLEHARMEAATAVWMERLENNP